MASPQAEFQHNHLVRASSPGRIVGREREIDLWQRFFKTETTVNLSRKVVVPNKKTKNPYAVATETLAQILGPESATNKGIGNKSVKQSNINAFVVDFGVCSATLLQGRDIAHLWHHDCARDPKLLCVVRQCKCMVSCSTHSHSHARAGRAG